MSDVLDMPHCSCPGGYAECPNNIHGMPANWKRTPGEVAEQIRRQQVVESGDD